MKKSIRVLAALMLAVMLMVSTYSFAVLAYEPAAPPAPAYIEPGDSPTIVDGDRSEWNLTSDFFAEMRRAFGQSGNPTVLSNLYLRYDCENDILYVLVLTVGDDWPAQTDMDEAWLAISDDPDEVINKKAPFSGFDWVDQGFDEDDEHARGWEASTSLTEGNYWIIAHTNVFDPNEGWQTSGTPKEDPLSLIIECDKTLIHLGSFDAKASRGQVALTWETPSGVDNAGFNLYRALLEDGPYTQINEALIAAEGDAVSGASYSFLDTPDYGTFYYKLEDVDYYGMTTLHGPVKVTVARPLRRPLYRPRLPEF